MFKKLTTLSLAAAALTCGVPALAANYVGGSIAAVNADFSIPQDADLVALYGRLGTEFSENFSGEVRLGTGIDDDNLGITKVELNHFYGAYVRGGIPVADVFFPYAVVGFTRAELERSNRFGSTKDSGTDVSFGVGTDIRISHNVDLNVEYMSYYDKNDVSIDGFAAGITYRF